MYLNVGFDLTAFGDTLYLYCPRCKQNSEHKVLGYIDDDTGEFVKFEDAVGERFRSVGT